MVSQESKICLIDKKKKYVMLLLVCANFMSIRWTSKMCLLFLIGQPGRYCSQWLGFQKLSKFGDILDFWQQCINYFILLNVCSYNMHDLFFLIVVQRENQGMVQIFGEFRFLEFCLSSEVLQKSLLEFLFRFSFFFEWEGGDGASSLSLALHGSNSEQGMASSG